MKLSETRLNAKFAATMLQYRCHKVVRAGQISFMAKDEANGQLMVHVTPSQMPLAVPLDFLTRHMPEIGGYLVVYEDGYLSYSPAKAFEEGYRPVTDPAPFTSDNEQKAAVVNAWRRCEELAYHYAHSLPEGSERDFAMGVYHRLRLVFSNGKSGLTGNANILTTEMPPHQLRVLVELTELSERLKNLTQFIEGVNGDVFAQLPKAEQDRMRKQQRIMQDLQEVLAERVAAF